MARPQMDCTWSLIGSVPGPDDGGASRLAADGRSGLPKGDATIPVSVVASIAEFVSALAACADAAASAHLDGCTLSFISSDCSSAALATEPSSAESLPVAGVSAAIFCCRCGGVSGSHGLELQFSRDSAATGFACCTGPSLMQPGRNKAPLV